MRSLAIAALFITTSALACPDLSGTYAVCRSQTGNGSDSTDMVITQSVTNKITTYTVTSTDAETNERTTETLKADGKTVTASETDPESGITIQLSTNVACNGNKALNINMKVIFNGEVASHVTTTVSKSGKTMTMVTKGTSMDEEINETVICE